MSFYIQKTIQFHDTKLNVFFETLSENNHTIWNEKIALSKAFSKKSDATVQSNLIADNTIVIKK